ncbi:MAG TPA: hypothetical protein VI704_01540 [Bacteroidota bacterium]|nr:hypothetical protein [Bacteroidota bacterium]
MSPKVWVPNEACHNVSYCPGLFIIAHSVVVENQAISRITVFASEEISVERVKCFLGTPELREDILIEPFRSTPLYTDTFHL